MHAEQTHVWMAPRVHPHPAYPTGCHKRHAGGSTRGGAGRPRTGIDTSAVGAGTHIPCWIAPRNGQTEDWLAAAPPGDQQVVARLASASDSAPSPQPDWGRDAG